MTGRPYQLVPSGHHFARTNRQTISQRAKLLRQLIPEVRTIAEICCGDGQRQQEVYQTMLGIESYGGLDIDPAIVALNRANRVACVQGDALDASVMRQFVQTDVLFFGPPLSANCDGHTSQAFSQVTPGFAPFTQRMLGTLQYNGLLVCICPNTTHMGEIQPLYQALKSDRPDIGLRLIHHRYATLTGDEEITALRLKYGELWFSAQLGDKWEIAESNR